MSTRKEVDIHIIFKSKKVLSGTPSSDKYKFSGKKDYPIRKPT